MKKNIIKVKKFQKPLMFLVVMLLMILSFIVGKITNANADDVSYDYSSDNISYDSTNNSLNATNVKDAIDELYEKVGNCSVGQFCYSKNMAFVKAYTYDESTCITGDETGCVETTCYENRNCPVGTIIDYLVNNTAIVRFHVLHDDGDTMTMQTQRNTIYNVAWHVGEDDTSKGPDTIMAALKTATNDWINVNPITITSSTTSFTGVDSIDNFCENDLTGVVTCSKNQYDIGNIAGTYRARMITTQEAVDSNVGQCLAWVSESKNNAKSCRMFMNNFLYESIYSEYCKNTALCVQDDRTENGADHNYGYLTMDAWSSTASWYVNRFGSLGARYTSDIGAGARAVVVVNK